MVLGFCFELLLVLSIPLWPHEGDVPAEFPVFASLAPAAFLNWLHVPAVLAYGGSFLLMAGLWTGCAYWIAKVFQAGRGSSREHSLTNR